MGLFFSALAWTVLSAGNPVPVSSTAFGTFRRPADAQPIVRPDPDKLFGCPMRGKPVRWEATHTFNPAAVVKDGKVYLFYRAEDDIGAGIGGYTSRLGLAMSDDGLHFKPMDLPVLYPADDDQKSREWFGGCEDPRCVEGEDGTYYLFYTQYHRDENGSSTDLGMASSRDLLHWKKLGPVRGVGKNGEVAVPPKSASLVTRREHGRLMASKVNGLYWLYYGAGEIRLLSSPDLQHWSAIPDFVIRARPGKFDSALVECGPPAVLTRRGIALLYNGMNASGADADPLLPARTYAGGQLLFDPHDPTKLLSRSDQPFIQPELPWETSGQYKDGTTFIEGLIYFKGRWDLYYGSADTYVGVAIAQP